MIDLDARQLGMALDILAERAPQCAVWAFGSRAAGKSKAYSDLDLVLLGPEPLSRAVLGQLKESFEESDLNIRVDVVDWRTLSVPFRKAIEPHCVLLRQGDRAEGNLPAAEQTATLTGA